MQKGDCDGTSQIDADSSLRPLAGFNQSNLVSTGPYSRKIQLYTSSIDLDRDFETLTSVTGYSRNDFRSIDDANATFHGRAHLARGRPDVGYRTSGERGTWCVERVHSVGRCINTKKNPEE